MVNGNIQASIKDANWYAMKGLFIKFISTGNKFNNITSSQRCCHENIKLVSKKYILDDSYIYDFISALAFFRSTLATSKTLIQ